MTAKKIVAILLLALLFIGFVIMMSVMVGFFTTLMALITSISLSFIIIWSLDQLSE